LILDFEQYFNATIAAIERRTIGSHEMIQDLWDQRDRKSRFLDFQHDMEMYRQETQYHRETITSCRELVVGIQEAMEGYTRQLDEILDNGDSSADDTKAILDLAAAKDSAVQNLVRMNDHIASEEAKLVKMRGEVPIIPEDWDELVAEFDPQPMRLIESGMGEKVFPIALRFQELDE
jgi:hypothetical protein